MADHATNPTTNLADLPARHQAAARTLAQTIAVLQEEHRRLAALPASAEVVRDLGHLAAGAREGLVLVGIEHGMRESRAHSALSEWMRALGEVNTVTLRPFTRDDWCGMAGAERFADGSEPLAAEGRFTLAAQRAWFLVLDATGGCLVVNDDPISERGGYCLDHPFASPAEAEAWFRAKVGNPAHLVDFLMAGFAAL